MADISFVVAFIAGIVSFASPCILPIIPGFLAYIAGTATDGSARKRDVFLASLFFVLGFSIVFALLGVLLNGVLSDVADGAQAWLSRIGGAVIIVFGLYLTGLVNIPWLGRAHTMKVQVRKHSRYVSSFLFGFAFAAGWTPCVGAVLGAIIALAASHPGSAFFLMLSYSLGLGVPFLVVGLFAGAADKFIQAHAQGFAVLSKVFGAILVLLGILVFTQELARVADLSFINSLLLK